MQLFTKNNNQWRAKPISTEDVERFQAAKAEYGYEHLLSHASYLINMGSPKDELRNKSIDAMVEELFEELQEVAAVQQKTVNVRDAPRNKTNPLKDHGLRALSSRL